MKMVGFQIGCLGLGRLITPVMAIVRTGRVGRRMARFGLGCVEPRYHQEVKLGKPMFGASGMFHSSIKGRPFVFSEETELAEDYHDFDDNILKYNISRIQGMIFYTRKNFE